MLSLVEGLRCYVFQLIDFCNCKQVSRSVLPLRSNLLEDSEEVISSHKKPDDDDKELDTSDHVCTDSHVPKNERDVVSDVQLESRSSSEELKREGPNGKEQQVQSSFELHRFVHLIHIGLDGCSTNTFSFLFP